MVSLREKWITMDTLCHVKFANHYCWFDALAIIMQTGYEVSSLARSSYPFLYVKGVVLPLFTMARGSTTPISEA